MSNLRDAARYLSFADRIIETFHMTAVPEMEAVQNAVNKAWEIINEEADNQSSSSSVQDLVPPPELFGEKTESEK